MRAAGRKSTHRLIIDDVSDHQFFGIVTPEPDYKTSLKINRALGISLSSITPVLSPGVKEPEFSRFMARSKFNDITYYLVSNRSGKSSLSSSYPTVDFILMINGTNGDEQKDEIRAKLRQIDEVTAVFILDNNRLSDEQILLQTP